MMRPYVSVLALVCLLLAATAKAEQSFPYKAYVVSDEVYVRSGPGQNYYPTDKLKRGQEVEIHRHDPGGWYAVRPPEGSFTWVSGRFLKQKEKGLAEVTGDRVAARVGSQFSDIRDVIQVRLERGELLDLLGQKQFASGSDAGTWYKVAPPSGEFRWVFGKYVDPDFPRDGVRKVSGDESPLVRPVQPASGDAAGKASGVSPDATKSSAEPPTAPSQTAQPEVSQATRTRRHAFSRALPSAAPASTTPEAAAPQVVGQQGEAASGIRDAGAPPQSTAAPPSVQPTPMRRNSPQEFQAELEALDMQLSIMLAEEPTVWEFGELDSRGRLLLAQAETALERGRVRLLLNRLALASDVKRRSDQVNATQTEIEQSNKQLAGLAQQRASAMRTADPAAQFDGTGRLARVVPSKLGAPQYALLDESGKVRCYVTPAPGVNLRYYEGRQVGVSGIRGYISEHNAQHVTAKHISALDSRMMR